MQGYLLVVNSCLRTVIGDILTFLHITMGDKDCRFSVFESQMIYTVYVETQVDRIASFTDLI